MKIYRLVDPEGRVVSGYNKDTDFYLSEGSAKSARSQLFRYGGRNAELRIQQATVSEFQDVQ